MVPTGKAASAVFGPSGPHGGECPTAVPVEGPADLPVPVRGLEEERSRAVSVGFVLMALSTSFAADGVGDRFDSGFEVRRIARSLLGGAVIVGLLISSPTGDMFTPRNLGEAVPFLLISFLPALLIGLLVVGLWPGLGRVALVEATPAGYREKARFDQPSRSDYPAWPYPVVADGKLFLRDMDVLLCFDLRGSG